MREFITAITLALSEPAAVPSDRALPTGRPTVITQTTRWRNEDEKGTQGAVAVNPRR